MLCIAVGAGASGAINMWYDRDIDAVMRRTAGRPLPAGRMLPGEALGFGVVLAVGAVRGDGAGGQLGGRRTAGADDRVLRLRLHDLAEAPHAAEHRDRRRRRRLAADDRLGGGDRRCRLGRGRAVRDHLFLDAAAFLGAVAVSQPANTPPPACRCCRSSPGPRETKRQMLLYTLVLWPATLAPVPARLGRTAIRRRALACSACCSPGLAIRVWREAKRPASAARGTCSHFSLLYLFLIFTVLLADRVAAGPWR